MAKTIKVIDLLNKIANGEEVPKKIKYTGHIYKWDILEHFYKEEKTGDDLFEQCIIDPTDVFLLTKVEIIEEQQDIDIQSYKELLLDQLRDREHTNADIYMLGTQINALIRAVKQLDKNIKDKE